MSTYFIGDVHGCADELENLLDLIQPTMQDRLISLGDLIHKGPQEFEVLVILNTMRVMGFNIEVVLGNHELQFLRYLDKVEKKQDPKVMKGWERNQALAEQIGDGPEANWIKTFPLWIRGPRWTAVHAGIGSKYVLPASPPTFSTASKRDWELTMLRYESPEGNMVSLGSETPESTYWAEKYDNRYGRVFFGHQPYLEAKQFTNAQALDTGCVFGGTLSAYCLETSRFYQTKALARYCEPMAGQDHWIN